MEVQTWSIEKITVGGRIRQDLGDLTELKQSMVKRGQINPITVEASGALIAGERRLRAAQELGWTGIVVRIWRQADAAELLAVEAEENTCRKDLTPGEAELFWQRLKELLKPEKSQGTRTDLNRTSADSAEVPSERQTRARAAKATGYSHDTLKKVEEVRTAAEDPKEPDEVREEAQRQHQALMKGETSVAPARAAVKRAKDQAAKLATGLGPGQWVEPPPPSKPEPSLTDRLVSGINKGQGLEKLAAEIQDADLDLDDETVFVLRNRLLDEIAERKALKEALDQEIKRRGYSTRKRTP